MGLSGLQPDFFLFSTKLKNGEIIHSIMQEVRRAEEGKIIKIVRVHSQDRIILPREVMRILGISQGDHLAFIKDSPGVRMTKVVLNIEK